MKRLFEHYGIRRMIFLYFTAAEIVFASLVTLSLYQRMKAQYISSVTEEAEIIVDQTAAAVEDYLQRMIKLSDFLYYGVIKNADLKDPSTAEKATILYDSEKERISNIGVFSGTGELEFAMPAARVADSVSVKELPLFSEALSRPDALLFSPPHVQRTFAGSEGQYRWGLTLARAVEIRERASTHQGVLMMELLYNLHHGRGIGMGVTDKNIRLIAVIRPDLCHLESSCTEAMSWNTASIPCVCDYSLKRWRMQEGIQVRTPDRRDPRLMLLRGDWRPLRYGPAYGLRQEMSLNSAG